MPKTIKWEERFDEVDYMICGCYNPECENRTYKPEDLKQFFQQTLEKIRDELVNEILAKTEKPNDQLPSIGIIETTLNKYISKK